MTYSNSKFETIEKHDVFISYARKDYALPNDRTDDNSVVAKVLKAFDKAGITYWIDKRGIHSGNEFASVISKAIENSRLFVFISSANSNASKWTCREIAAAEDIQIPIIPLRVDNTPYNSTIRLYIANLDYINYQERGDEAFNDLVNSVTNYLTNIKAKEEAIRKDKELASESHNAEEREKKRKALLQAQYLAKLDLIKDQISDQEFRRKELIKEMEKEGLEVQSFKNNLTNASQTNIQQNISIDDKPRESNKKRLNRKTNIITTVAVVILLCTTLIAIINYRKASSALGHYINLYYDSTHLLDIVSTYYPIIIQDIKIANVDKQHNIISDYGEPIFSEETQYLLPQITYSRPYPIRTADSTEIILAPLKYKLLYKWYKPDGSIGRGPNSSIEFTKGLDSPVVFSAGEYNTMVLEHWGNDIKGNFLPGKYRLEIWYYNELLNETICIGTKRFEIFSRQEIER